MQIDKCADVQISKCANAGKVSTNVQISKCANAGKVKKNRLKGLMAASLLTGS